MNAIVTVVGRDRVGIIAAICNRLGREMGLSIRIQREEIFNAMHTI